MVEINEKKIEQVNQENNEGTIEQVNHESTIDINNLEFDDYVDVPKMRKMELLNEEWGTSKNALKGTLSLVDSNIYFIITDVRTLDDQIIRNPFTKKRIESVYCIVTNEQIFKEEFKKFNKKEVAFKYLVPNKDKNIDESNEDSNEDSHKIIRADFNSIYLWDSFVDVDDMNQNELLNLIQATYKPYKILLADDVQQILQDKNREMLQTQEELLNRLQEVQLMAEQEISDVIDLYLKKEEDFIRMNVQLEEQATELNTRISQLMSETDKANSNLEKIYKQLQSYKDMGFEVDLPMVMNEVDTQENINEEPIEINHRIDHIHHYIKHGGEKKLNFQNDIVKKIYAGLCTNQIIILSGNPGTGKTSLIKKFSESISAVYKHISVQPNWTDNQDLLGYFNPIDKQYIATPFLDAIIDANNDSSKLYIINLDEMNLSQVEYYFSEFLSVLQTEEKTLHLYSEHIANALGKSFKTKMDNSASLSDEEKNEINLKVKMHQRYPAKFNIPENIRFVGTLNKDATTKNLSPKVIDRSLIIEIQDYSYRSIINDEHSEVLEPLDIKPDLMQQKISIVEGNLETRLSRLGDFLKKYNIFLEGRFYAQVEQMIGSNVFEKENDLFDFIVASKILPKINMSLEGHEQFIIDFENEIENTTIAKKIFKAMELSAKNSSILSYWR